MTAGAVAAVDLGATSGRVIAAQVSSNELRLHQVLRFPTSPRTHDDGIHWNVDEIFRSVESGLRLAIRESGGLISVGVDSWAIDYALVGKGGMLGAPFHYRDSRSLAQVDAVHARVSAAQLYAQNGLQHLPFTTLFQLADDLTAGRFEAADRLLLIPDLVMFWLSGAEFAERTNASTTGLLDVRSSEWNDGLIAELGLPRRLFPELVDSGTRVGGLLPSMISTLGGGEAIELTTVGSHDTASAVVAVPSIRDDFAYISCGTWGLVGVELESPVLSEASRLANFTNELGVDGRVRYLHNVMGLWLLSESVRTWEEQGIVVHLPMLIEQAAQLRNPGPLFDVNDESFLSPGDIPARIAEWCAQHGLPAPQTPAEFTRSILESMSVAFADAVRAAASLSGREVGVIHIVGGGSQNALLCQLTADRSGLPVLAGPVEATAIGNVLVQARAHGIVSGSLETLRNLVARNVDLVEYLPRAGSVAA